MLCQQCVQKLRYAAKNIVTKEKAKFVWSEKLFHRHLRQAPASKGFSSTYVYMHTHTHTKSTPKHIQVFFCLSFRSIQMAAWWLNIWEQLRTCPFNCLLVSTQIHNGELKSQGETVMLCRSRSTGFLPWSTPTHRWAVWKPNAERENESVASDTSLLLTSREKIST